ncbi:MAG: methylmalonyl-CoA mutase [Caulobacteraceae bacterium]|nr:methylmalonyl-CoA mutase [Caulobacter sp.]
MADDVSPATADLAAGFPPATREAWLRLVDKTLRGADRATLATPLADGIEVLPLYAGEDAATAHRPPLAPRDPLRPWDVRTLVAHPDPARANAQALADLEGGAASVLLRMDPAGRRGLAEPAALARALEGVHTDLAPVALDAGALGPQAAEALSAAAGRGPSAPLAFHMDPLGALALGELDAGAARAALPAWAAEGARLHAVHPAATLMRAGGDLVHEAGGAEAQELGFAAACGLAYTRALAEAGLPVEAAFAGVVLGLAADPRLFVTAAKLRAARFVWGKLAAAHGAPPLARIEALGARRTLSRLDPWTNLLRLTSAAVGAAVGGADAIVLPPFTAPLTEDGAAADSEFARRQARNTQLVLMEEAHLGRVADPAGGSGLVERLTDAFARAGWAELQRIEAAGGALAVLADGSLAAAVGEARAKLQRRVLTRRDGLIGVSEFPALAEAGVEVEPLPGSATPPPRGPLSPDRLAAPFERLRAEAAARKPTPRAYLALLGPPAESGVRTNWTRNLLAAGGVAADAGPPDAYVAAEAPTAVIVGPDARYAEEAAPAAEALRAAGARSVWLAGRPGALAERLRAAGVDGALHAGEDAAAALRQILETAP